MSDQEAGYLETFGSWLRNLANDARALSTILEQSEHPEELRRPIAGALNYLFKSLDLIDDGIEGLGYLDDAFVLRVAVSRIPSDLRDQEGVPEVVRNLAEQVESIRTFLGEEYERLQNFVEGLTVLTVRGRSVDELLNDERVREEFIADVIGWANRYEAPGLGQDVKNLVKLRAFLSAKL